MIRLFSIIVSFSMLLTLALPGTSMANTNGEMASFKNMEQLAEAKISDRLSKEFENEEKVTFLVKFKEKADLSNVVSEVKAKAESQNLSPLKAEYMQRSAVISELKYTALTSQAKVKEFLKREVKNGTVDNFHSFYIVNGMAVTGTKNVAQQLARFVEVEKILPDETRYINEVKIDRDAETIQSEIQNVEWNVERVGAPGAWAMGIDGSGVVVASIDTGVDWDHPALKEKYLGYDLSTGEVDHTFSFYDAVNGQAEAYDDNGHGTHVTGTMVGSEPDGSNQIGVAPGAKFISAKAFTGSGSGSDSDIIAAGEWILAPGGDVTKAPDIVNNSWGGGSGMDEWYRDIVIAWREAGIFPEFSAGNTTIFNPGGPGSIAVPANYPESFATGATDSNDQLAEFSLEGPSPYGEIKPEVAAPGVNIRSSVPGGDYEGGWNGTSMAGPAVSGTAALVLHANSSLTVDQLEDILMTTATPLTDDEYPDSPNNGYGHGLVNALNAVSAVMDGLGTIEGQVTIEGDDSEAPTFEHEPIQEAYSEMDLQLEISASDNVSVTSVTVHYSNANGEEQTLEAERVSGDYLNGEYVATIPGEDVIEGNLTYSITVNDFGNNTVTSEQFNVEVVSGITVGYFTDFEGTPVGWTTYGENNSWEHGVPTSGPEGAASGENVYATNLEGDYNNDENSTLLMPPIDLPEGESYLQFKHWYNIENGWDYGNVFISTDMEEWTSLLELTDINDQWSEIEVDLSEYAGQRVYIAFNLDTDFSVLREGWYLDDVGLSDTSLNLDQPNTIQGNPPIEKKDAPKVDPSKIQPSFENNYDKLDEDTTQNEVSLLPLEAEVSVIETGRSVVTDPSDGSYSMIHPAGEFTVLAESYGYYSSEQTVNVEADESVTANFTLEELPEYTISGTVTSSNSGQPIEGATLLLVEDANIQPVETDENGQFSLTAYEGQYTLKVFARDYYSTEIPVNLNQNQELNVELEPMFTYPGGEIGYDDGTAENARAFYDAGNKWAVKMSLPEGKENALVTEGVFQFHGTDWPVPGGTGFAVEVWDASGPDGLPGEKLVGPIEAEATRSLDEWTVVDLREHNIQVSGDFYMVYVQTIPYPDSPGLATDENGPYAERSFQSVGGAWSQSPSDEGNYMIRARVAYPVEDAIITSPSDGLITSESSLTVEGTASPTTSIKLLNNGVEVGQAEIGEEGSFSIPITLIEGVNELRAINYSNGEQANESNVVTVILDTQAPELTIDHPAEGDLINRETVTVEGSIMDDHLDYVTVNGQEATVENGHYSKRIILNEGVNTIEVEAFDLAGNSSSQVVTVEADYTAPVIENVQPTEDQVVEAGETVMIEFNSEADLDATFAIYMPLTNINQSIENAIELPMMETEDGHYVGYWTAPKDLEAEGAVVEVKAVDHFGNESRMEAEGKITIVDQDNGKGKGKGKGKGNGTK